jgi:type VI secretion system protein ImpB
MAKESVQKKIGRVRPPRVHITYDVETGGAMEKRDIPFVVGVLADLSGDNSSKLKKLGKRNFTEIDRDTFDTVMAKQEPKIGFKVANKLTDAGGDLSISLEFKKLSDFDPANVVKKVAPMNELLELRNKLSNLQSSLYGNDKLEELLNDAVAKTEAARKGSGSTEAPAASAKEPKQES